MKLSRRIGVYISLIVVVVITLSIMALGLGEMIFGSDNDRAWGAIGLGLASASFATLVAHRIYYSSPVGTVFVLDDSIVRQNYFMMRQELIYAAIGTFFGPGLWLLGQADGVVDDAHSRIKWIAGIGLSPIVILIGIVGAHRASRGKGYLHLGDSEMRWITSKGKSEGISCSDFEQVSFRFDFGFLEIGQEVDGAGNESMTRRLDLLEYGPNMASTMLAVIPYIESSGGKVKIAKRL